MAFPLSALLGSVGVNLPAAAVVGISLVVGLAMVVVFRYASDQKAIHLAKDHLKAHLLALRLFQDQIPVVLRAYGRIVLGTGHYLRLACQPLLFVIVPLTFLMVQLDRYLGSMPLEAGRPFLVVVQVDHPEGLNEVSLQLPHGLATTAPAAHVPSESRVVWRAVAETFGEYSVHVQAPDQAFSKQVVVGAGLSRLSSVRLRGKFWERMLVSGEPALPDHGPIASIAVQYPDRNIAFAGFEWNWVWLFLVLSLAAGFLFKSMLGIEI